MTHAVQYVLTHGALALFTWILAQQAGAPISSALLLLSVGSLASAGRIDIRSFLAAGFGACLAADGFWYQVGRSGWSRSYLSPRTGTWTSRVLGLISQHSAGALLTAKFVSCSNLAALMAGRAGMALGRFLVFDSIASFLWAGGYIAIGYLVGNHVEAAVRYASAPLLVLLGSLAVWSLATLMRSAWRPRLHAAVLATLTLFFCGAVPGAGQYSDGMGGTAAYATSQSSAAGQASGLTASVPSGPATDDVLHLTLRDAISSGLKYNLGSIETGENTRIARGQRLLALSRLLPEVSAGVSENVEQVNLATFGLKVPGIPNVIGPYSYSSAYVSASQTLFSFESIQRFRAARTAEQAAQLSCQDILDALTLTVGNAYLQVIEASSRIDAQEARV
jgi:membrane protein DedA with SNARE-associated domain